MLSEYLSGCSPLDEKLLVEVHLADCETCRKLIAETHSILSRERSREALMHLLSKLKSNLWPMAAGAMLALSFVFPKYFLQFLVAASLAGIKWIMDSRTTRMLIMVREAWKSGNMEKAEKIFSKMDKDQ